MKTVYLILSLVGTVVPYYFLGSFLLAHGLNLGLFLSQMWATEIARFFVADVVISSLVLWAYMAQEVRQHGIRYWWVCLLANLLVGVSLALPLFLYFREVQLVPMQRKG
jgi:Terpene cyclase DEP1